MEQEFAQIDTPPDKEPAVQEAPAVDPAATIDKPKQDPWKTAFIVLIGVVLLSAVLIYSTSSKRPEPTTVLQTDAGGQPVQPLNPASGVEEERLAALPSDAITSNSVPGRAP